mmetsp:Transcript_12846/g.36960  ORF Transcript_12846/g.36960 Transcript_12846/m.36960 type:complete len:204 (+) Transcript_12846:837-1448(+)
MCPRHSRHAEALLAGVQPALHLPVAAAVRRADSRHGRADGHRGDRGDNCLHRIRRLQAVALCDAAARGGADDHGEAVAAAQRAGDAAAEAALHEDADKRLPCEDAHGVGDAEQREHANQHWQQQCLGQGGRDTGAGGGRRQQHAGGDEREAGAVGSGGRGRRDVPEGESDAHTGDQHANLAKREPQRQHVQREHHHRQAARDL